MPLKFGEVLSVSNDLSSAKIKIFSSDQEENVSVTRLRYLARAYTCSLDDLDLKNIPKEVNEIIKAQDGD